LAFGFQGFFALVLEKEEFEERRLRIRGWALQRKEEERRHCKRRSSAICNLTNV
jgi:hypothetical protein